MTTRTKRKVSAAPQPAAQSGFSLIPHQKLLDIYAAMVRCSLLEERIRRLTKRRKQQANTGPTASRIAPTASLLVDLLANDIILPSHGDRTAPFLKGVPLKRMMAAALAPSADAAASFADHRHFVFSPAQDAATQFAVAGGLALACKASRQKQVVIAFAESPQGDSGAWKAALQFAGAHNLPVLFVCHASADTAAPPADSAQLGLPVIPVDANDAVAVYRVAYESIARARLGRGPTLIECLLDSPHSPGATAPESPLEIMEKYLERKGLFRKTYKAKVIAQFLRKLDAATAVI